MKLLKLKLPTLPIISTHCNELVTKPIPFPLLIYDYPHCSRCLSYTSKTTNKCSSCNKTQKNLKGWFVDKIISLAYYSPFLEISPYLLCAKYSSFSESSKWFITLTKTLLSHLHSSYPKVIKELKNILYNSELAIIIPPSSSILKHHYSMPPAKAIYQALTQYFNITLNYLMVETASKKNLTHFAKNASERKILLKNKFHLPNNFPYGQISRQVIIIDDIITTATTVNILAKQIKKNKNIKITAFSLFRTL